VQDWSVRPNTGARHDERRALQVLGRVPLEDLEAITAKFECSR
jgi:hypothetical protein